MKLRGLSLQAGLAATYVKAWLQRDLMRSIPSGECAYYIRGEENDSPR
jgi:hypothetical protein